MNKFIIERNKSFIIIKTINSNDIDFVFNIDNEYQANKLSLFIAGIFKLLKSVDDNKYYVNTIDTLCYNNFIKYNLVLFNNIYQPNNKVGHECLGILYRTSYSTGNIPYNYYLTEEDLRFIYDKLNYLLYENLSPEE